MTETEPTSITVLLGTSGERLELPPQLVKLVWEAVRRGDASSPEEYINDIFRRLLAKNAEAMPPTESSTGDQ